MRLIFVPTADRPESALALDTAFTIAATLGANVVGCHVRAARLEPSSAELPLVSDVSYGAAARPDAASELTSRAARALFERVAGRHGYSLARRVRVAQRQTAFWRDRVGTPARIFAIEGPVADLTVAARPRPKSSGRATAFMLAALLYSTRPVLVVPQRAVGAIGRRILVAWNQSPEAALTVALAMPLLQRAERVVVVSAGSEARTGPKAMHLARYLASWDVPVERVRTKGRRVEAEIEAVHRDTRSDLLVMGAYSRSRLRQRIFGGVTEHMLFKTDLPALMLHR